MTAPSSPSDVELAVLCRRRNARRRPSRRRTIRRPRRLTTSHRPVLDHRLAALSATGLLGKENQGPSQTLWKIAGDRLIRGDLQWRARSKPRGYAGDFEMQADFWFHRESGDPWAEFLDRYFLKQQAVEAVRAVASGFGRRRDCQRWRVDAGRRIPRRQHRQRTRHRSRASVLRLVRRSPASAP